MLIAIILLMLTLIIIILLTAAGNYFYKIALKPGEFARLMKSRDHQNIPNLSQIEKEAKDWWSNITMNVIYMKTHDGMSLQGYHITNENPTNRLVILAHGYSGDASEMAVYAKIYYEMGFDIFAPDNRGHGKSEGNAIGMGWLDRLDYLQWMELLVSEINSQTEIILHGHSMGGAIVSILSGEKLPPNVKGIISDCSYDSVKNILAYQLKNLFKLPAFPIIPVTSLICKIRSGYYLGEANVAAQVACSKVPILYIHGNQDTFVPCEMTYNLYDATKPSLRDIWIVNGAKHIESIKVAPNEYIAKIKTFLACRT